MFFAKLLSLFTLPMLPKNLSANEQSAIKSIVASRSHGNVRLQKGKYFTSKDIAQQYKRIEQKQIANGRQIFR